MSSTSSCFSVVSVSTRGVCSTSTIWTVGIVKVTDVDAMLCAAETVRDAQDGAVEHCRHRGASVAAQAAAGPGATRGVTICEAALPRRCSPASEHARCCKVTKEARTRPEREEMVLDTSP